MAQDRDQYIQFTIKLLRGSFALSALWQDALNYHMIDQPEKLIAMRLTEYYELMSKGQRPGANVPATPPSTPTGNLAPVVNNVVPPTPASNIAMPAPPPPSNPGTRIPPSQPGLNGNGNPSSRAASNQPTAEMRLDQINDIVTRSSAPVVEQNADEAADYWSAM